MANKHDELMEEALANQIPEYQGDIEEYREPETLSTKQRKDDHEETKPQRILTPEQRRNKMFTGSADVETRRTTNKQENLFEEAEARAGWITVNRAVLGERSKFYPEDWQFLIRPATVEVIRNWSLLDETNPNSIDDLFNEILKYCLSIKTARGNQPWQAINNWDRFFFVLLVREYTFVKGENNIEFYEDCENCDSSVKFNLTSDSLTYDLPDESVMEYYDVVNRTWYIDPADFGVESDHPITLYVPTIERDANIKAWLMAEYQENEKKKFDNVFIKFLPWLVPKISKDTNTAKMQIRKAEMAFKSWDAEMFSFMNDVLKNIAITPGTDIKAHCSACGEEATTRLRFPDGVGALFNVVNRSTKFGTK